MATASLPVMFLLGGVLIASGDGPAQVHGRSAQPLTPGEQYEAIQEEWQAAVKAEFVARKGGEDIRREKNCFREG